MTRITLAVTVYILINYGVIATTVRDVPTPQFREFDLKLFEGLRSYQPDEANLVFSPASIRTVLAMLRDGAAGETRSILETALGDTSGYTSLLYPRAESDGLEIANALFVSSRLQTNPKYQTRVTSRYGAWFEYTDFSRPRSAADKINEWVQRATRGHVEKLVSRDTLSANSVLLLANAVHLHGKWSHPFPVGNTKPANFYEGFHATNTSIIRVPTMSQYNYFRYGVVPTLNAKVLEMPFQEPEGLSMVILLPDARDGLLGMLERLQPSSLTEILGSMGQPTLVSVTLPRFSAATAQRLNSILPQEVAAVFGSDADLSGIAPRGEVQVSQALHKAALSVDEEGAIGSAVSAVTAILLHSGSPLEFHASHPFAYMVLDRREAADGRAEPVFMGYVTSVDAATADGAPLSASAAEPEPPAATTTPPPPTSTTPPTRIVFGNGGSRQRRPSSEALRYPNNS